MPRNDEMSSSINIGVRPLWIDEKMIPSAWFYM